VGTVSTAAWVALIVALFVPVEAAALAAIGWGLRHLFLELHEARERLGSIEDYLWGPQRARNGGAERASTRPARERRHRD
jgi:hypothetical protein